MARWISCLALCIGWSAVALAAPSIGGLQNNYSYLLSGTPNYGIAQGSIFVLYGSQMAPAGLLQGGFNPVLDKNLGGVTLTVTVNGSTTQAIPYYVSPGQISAILPSATPVGDGTITVAYGGQTSPPFPIKVVRSAFGLMTMSGNGLGQAVMMDAGFNLLTPTNAAAEDQVVIFWGSGLGGYVGDETMLISNPQSLDSLPFELYIGNKKAETLYHGRSQYPGLDQIVARIPRGSTGCFVSVYVKTGDYISNFNTIPVAAEGKVCAEPFVDPSELQTFTQQESVTAGWLYLGRFTNFARLPGGGTTHLLNDAANAQFLRYSPFNYGNYGGISQPSFGNCVVSMFVLTNPFVAPTLEYLDAGQVSLTLPSGAVKPLVKNSSISSYVLSGATTDASLPLFVGQPGETFAFQGTGSDKVGPFTASVTLPPAFSTTNLEGMTNISRSQDLELTWMGGDPSSYVVVTGTSSDLATVFTAFSCSARASAGRLTVPRDVLASMVPSKVIANSPLATTGQLIVYNYMLPKNFTVDKIDNANISFYTGETAVVDYQ
ncbi:MAG: hypothetical protein GC160_02645 [Acidobacteria bacterium]|nr:hypothetical protein [Acidobacteriota bacterium]